MKINNLPIISHVVKRGQETDLGEVIVCAEDEEILSAVKKNGGQAILTGNHHKNGTERIAEALQKLKKNEVDFVISLQGDEPAIDPLDIKNLFNLMIESNSEIGTLASEINDNFVKAINFSRDDISKESSNIYHHIGVYCYKSSILKKFVNLKQTKNEINNRLEQLRVIDNDIKINVALAKSSPIGVDTKEDYIALKKIMEYKS